MSNLGVQLTKLSIKHFPIQRISQLHQRVIHVDHVLKPVAEHVVLGGLLGHFDRHVALEICKKLN